MGKINDLLVVEAEKYISALLSEKLPENITYHNYDHALRITRYAETIGQHEGLTDEEMNILRLCALFYTSGYVNSFDQPTEESVGISTTFLSRHNVDEPVIAQVSEIIRAAGRLQDPEEKIAEVLCDADMMDIVEDNGIEQFDLLYAEVSRAGLNPIKRSAFEKNHLDFLTRHTYFTGYGKSVLQPKKEMTAGRISERLMQRKMKEGKKDSPSKKGFDYSRGVETMFRITARNQINLNSIADNKSNILISVNAIIISIIITMLAGNMGSMMQNIVPVLVFLVICLITIIIAILSTRPNIVTSKFTEEDLRNKKVDLTFFGNFDKMDYNDYQEYLKAMMKDEDHLYSALIKNQYSLGRILAKKFRLVRIAYNVFMIGIIITVIVFLVNFLIIGQPV